MHALPSHSNSLPPFDASNASPDSSIMMSFLLARPGFRTSFPPMTSKSPSTPTTCHCNPLYARYPSDSSSMRSKYSFSIS